MRHILLPLSDRLTGMAMLKHLKFLQDAQWWPRERIEAHRNSAIQRLINVCYSEVPYYRELLDSAGVKPADIRTCADLTRIPISTKDMIRPNFPDQITRPTGQRTYESKTSGSTGKNFVVLEDYETAGHYRACFMLALVWAGWTIGQTHLQTGMHVTRDWPRRFKDTLFRCHYVSARDLSDASLDQALQNMERRRIAHLWGYPGSLYYIARRARVRGWNQPLRTVVTWGDNVTDEYRRTIEDVFHTPLIDTYGCGEGIQISAQCGQGPFYHEHSLSTLVEYIDNDGQPAPAGTTAHLVLTRFHPGPMPLIRYRVGDLGVSAGDQQCPCGRNLKLMQSIEGRATDVVLTPSGNRLIVHFFTGLLENLPEIDSFQAVQEQPDSLLLRLVPTGQPSDELAQRISQQLRDNGADLEINVEWVPKSPPPKPANAASSSANYPPPPPQTAPSVPLICEQCITR